MNFQNRHFLSQPGKCRTELFRLELLIGWPAQTQCDAPGGRALTPQGSLTVLAAQEQKRAIVARATGRTEQGLGNGRLLQQSGQSGAAARYPLRFFRHPAQSTTRGKVRHGQRHRRRLVKIALSGQQDVLCQPATGSQKSSSPHSIGRKVQPSQGPVE